MPFEKGNPHRFKPGQSGNPGGRSFKQRVDVAVRKAGTDKTAAAMLVHGITRFVIPAPPETEMEAARRKRDHPKSATALYITSVPEWLACVEFALGKPGAQDAGAEDQATSLLDALAGLDPDVAEWQKAKAVEAEASA